MYTTLRRLSLSEALLIEAPAFTAALLVAEPFYKFHSFTLELAAFLATWLVCGALFDTGRKLLRGANGSDETNAR